MEHQGADKLFVFLLALGGSLLGLRSQTANRHTRSWLLYFGILCFALAATVMLYVFGVKRFWAWMDATTAERIAKSRQREAVARRSIPQAIGNRLPTPRGIITIDSASYGIDSGDHWTPVTDTVAGMIVDNRLAVTASHEVLGITDPYEGREKRLDIEWSLDGIRQQKMFFVENTAALLPPGTYDEYESLTSYLNGEQIVGPSSSNADSE